MSTVRPHQHPHMRVVVARCFHCDWRLTERWDLVNEDANKHLKEGCLGPVIAMDGNQAAGAWTK